MTEITRYVKGRPRLEWVKPAGRRNEVLDLEVYAIAAAHKLQLNRYRAPDWDRLERQVQPLQGDLLVGGTQPPAGETKAVSRETAAQTSTAPRVGRVGNFLKGWR